MSYRFSAVLEKCRVDMILSWHFPPIDKVFVHEGKIEVTFSFWLCDHWNNPLDEDKWRSQKSRLSRFCCWFNVRQRLHVENWIFRCQSNAVERALFLSRHCGCCSFLSLRLVHFTLVCEQMTCAKVLFSCLCKLEVSRQIKNCNHSTQVCFDRQRHISCRVACRQIYS